ncbi:MAG: hypothetical protein GTN46_13710 [Gammaproteobacteria bacterium]|nr:hypothetical protein [Gammaproteobacteria bacterium]NIN62395.1 hypothetical protein [Gammaproteobacteria bacterium]NIO61449.1 hypothetical protein [Gammaproteobacteria bacterium]NIQ20075.1 hypothetical protein [Gammaproteobacteria bacterium]NIT06224.1 hypothetical protein [Gammaproteobacteria bacterium]
MQISMVKKIKADGSPCRKCQEVGERLKSAGLEDRINRVIIADEREPDSEGMQLAVQYQIDRAPFFLVEEEGQEPRIYTVYMRFLKEVLQTEASEEEQLKDILDSSPDLDYI